jgi:DNA (cytosine-5)-methyltransferase 1
MRVGGLFTGIGGFERAFSGPRHDTVFICEIDEACCRVLHERFDGVQLIRDVRELRTLPKLDILTAGFPCQDFSQAGRTAGIKGRQASLFVEIARLLSPERTRPGWVVLENVPFILYLNRGEAMKRIASVFEGYGYRWAYRIVDSIAFGRPQRRRRWIFVASREGDPRDVLFTDDSGRYGSTVEPAAFGFYWTEGNRGLGLAADAIPPLKVGSAFGMPASPAIWDRRHRRIVTPDVRDAERLQGFPRNWTKPADDLAPRVRWRLIGNAISVDTARWLERNISKPRRYDRNADREFTMRSWPSAAWGNRGAIKAVQVSDRPVSVTMTPIMSFLEQIPIPLSARAAEGFLCRIEASTLRRPQRFVADIRHHIAEMREV